MPATSASYSEKEQMVLQGSGEPAIRSHLTNTFSVPCNPLPYLQFNLDISKLHYKKVLSIMKGIAFDSMMSMEHHVLFTSVQRSILISDFDVMF